MWIISLSNEMIMRCSVITILDTGSQLHTNVVDIMKLPAV